MSDVKIMADDVEIGEVRRLSLKPGDIVVLSTETVLAMGEGERLMRTVKTHLEKLGHDNEVVLIDGGMRLGVIG